jgi:hypothetical protein
MNARQRTPAKAAHSVAKETVEPVAITLLYHPGIDAAANDDPHAEDARRVNPLWMITAGLGVFFAFLAIVATFD